MLVNQQKVMIFVDEANFSKTAQRRERQPDLVKLRSFLANPDDGRDLIEMVIYMGQPPQRQDMPEMWQKIHDSNYRRADYLQFNGMIVVQWEGKIDHNRKFRNGDPRYASNVDMIMAMDALEFAVEAKPDIVVLVTGDGDFAYLAEKLRRRGIRVEAASMEKEINPRLKKSVNAFIDLTEFFNTLEGAKIGDLDGLFDDDDDS